MMMTKQRTTAEAGGNMQNRTSKPERRAARKQYPKECQRLGTGQSARIMRSITPDMLRLCSAMNVPVFVLAGADPGANHWSAYMG
jgi:hypothetical protein